MCVFSTSQYPLGTVLLKMNLLWCKMGVNLEEPLKMPPQLAPVRTQFCQTMGVSMIQSLPECQCQLWGYPNICQLAKGHQLGTVKIGTLKDLRCRQLNRSNPRCNPLTFHPPRFAPRNIPKTPSRLFKKWSRLARPWPVQITQLPNLWIRSIRSAFHCPNFDNRSHPHFFHLRKTNCEKDGKLGWS